MMKQRFMKVSKMLSLAALALLFTCLCLPGAFAQNEEAGADIGELIAALDAVRAKEALNAEICGSLLGRAYKKGGSGKAITTIKDRMKELGYYSANATYNDKFNDIMFERITDFQESSGLPAAGVIDDATLECLYGADPVRGPFYPQPYAEPELTMIIPQGSRMRKIERQGDVLSAGIEVKNISHQSNKRIIGYYLSVYTVDAEGRKLQEMIVNTPGLLPCGSIRYSAYFDLENRSMIDKVYVGIKKVYYRDGSRTETIESPDYMCWTL